MSASANSFVAAVISPQPELAAAFVEILCGQGARSGKVNLKDMADIVVEALPLEPLHALIERVKSADFSVLLLRFVDEQTLDTARAIMRSLPPLQQASVHMAIARQSAENEFKMSCPKCGQKLMIKDSLAFRRTQCPRCKHPFTIPGQSDLVRHEFLIPSSHKISTAQLGDRDSCLTVLANAYRQIGGRHADDKGQTMRLDDFMLDNPGDTRAL